MPRELEIAFMDRYELERLVLKLQEKVVLEELDTKSRAELEAEIVSLRENLEMTRFDESVLDEYLTKLLAAIKPLYEDGVDNITQEDYTALIELYEHLTQEA